MDVDRDGELSYEELKRGLEREGLRGPEIKALTESMDADHNGKVNYSEFLAGFGGESQFTEEGIRRAFEMLDADGNGVVSKEELLSLFAGGCSVIQKAKWAL
jgi:Ca2+-binding EF-hand superfamily protein